MRSELKVRPADVQIYSVMLTVFVQVLFLVSFLGAGLGILQVSRTSAETARGMSVERPEFVIGKDREVFHASVDLNWLFRKAVDPVTWHSILGKFAVCLKRLNADYDNAFTFREVATQLMCEFRECDPQSPLRCAQLEDTQF
jgi:hypothetical protein